MTRKSQPNSDQVLKKISGKNNINIATNSISMYAVEPTHKKIMKESGIMFSPNKRLRTISRKK